MRSILGVNILTQKLMTKHACPCCGFLTLDGRYNFDICPVCFWEDEYMDGSCVGGIIQFPSGPDDPSPSNHELTLNEARNNYKKFGAVELRLVKYCRSPLIDEIP